MVKYKGKCSQCGKEIPQGEYALWSRTSKAIKHANCDSGTPTEEKKAAVLELECFICGKSARCAECGFDAECNRAVVSQACICSQCLSDREAYKNYQEAFLAKIRKATKVKI